jgi:Ni,Fe-hydrogenase III component G
MMPNTPKAIIWTRLMDECVIVTPDTIPDIANVNAEINAGRAKWLTDADFDSWLKAKIGVDLAALKARISETRFFSMQEARGALLVLKGEGLRELVDVQGLRFYARQVKVS